MTSVYNQDGSNVFLSGGYILFTEFSPDNVILRLTYAHL